VKWFDIDANPLTWPSKMGRAPAAKVNVGGIGNDATQNTTRLLVPLEPLGETWSILDLTSQADGSTRMARCLLIENVSKSADGVYKGTFSSIMDVVAMKVDEMEISDLRLKWQ